VKTFAAGIIFFCCFSTLITSVSFAREQVPYKRILDNPRHFYGHGGSIINPSSVNSIPIGLFAPFDQENPAAYDLFCGVNLAIEQANLEGGYQGIAFRIVPRWAGSPWGAGSKEVIRLVYEDRVWAIIAFRDGAGHIAQQIAAKSYIPVIAPISSTSSLTHAGVPWIFRLPPDDRVQVEILVKHSIVDNHLNRIGLISGIDQNSHAAAGEMEKELTRNNIPPIFHFNVPSDLLNFMEIARRIKDFNPDGLILCLQASIVPQFLKTLQKTGIDCPVSMPWIPGVDLKKLKVIYQGTICMVEPFLPPAPTQQDEFYQQFRRDFKKRFGVFPTYSAAYAYDAARLIIHAIRSHGLNRPGIRQGLEELAGIVGVSGKITWDNGGGNSVCPVIKIYR
jgi:ABC-type branched-subunit amino acid transport system substrate-binding protein